MDVILGIDIGGSTTKIVGLRTDGSVISMLRVRAEDQVTSLYGALGNYLTSNRLSLRDVRRVVLTGVGASYVEGDIYGLPTCKVGEFSASGTGKTNHLDSQCPCYHRGIHHIFAVTGSRNTDKHISRASKAIQLLCEYAQAIHVVDVCCSKRLMSHQRNRHQ